MIAVNNLCKSFTLHIRGEKRIEACREISFDVPAGSFLGLAGPSGSGKSTILKCLYRTYLASSGSIHYQSASHRPVDLVTLDDRTMMDLRAREMGYVSQFLKVIPRVSALEVVMEQMISRNGTGREDARKQAEDLLERLRIPTRLFDTYPATFSGGEQQRINIARAVSWKPRLLLLDEPTASLDNESVGIVLDILRELREEGTTMIGIFHDNELMDSVTDAVFHIN